MVVERRKRREEKEERRSERKTKADYERELHRSMCQCACMSEQAREVFALCATFLWIGDLRLLPFVESKDKKKLTNHALMMKWRRRDGCY
jgi:hypothetical protein